MTASHWALIGTLAFAAFAIRLTGLLAGDAIRKSRFAPLLEDLPGVLIVALVSASLAGQPLLTWAAAGVALSVALLTNHVIATMLGGVIAFAVMTALGF